MSVFKSFQSLFFPPFCYHCQGSVSSPDLFLCEFCSHALPFVDLDKRCRYCDSSIEENIRCTFCKENKKRLIFKSASVFSPEGPALSLLNRMSNGGQDYLAKDLAAFSAMQFSKLSWPLPDLIVPVPDSRLTNWERGYSATARFSEEMSYWLECPYQKAIKRDRFGYSLSGEFKFWDKTVLIVNIQRQFQEQEKVARALLPALPMRIYCLNLVG